MSALTAPRERETKAGSSRPTLRAVPSSSRPLARAPFIVLLAAILVAGMVGVLLLNTSLQNQAFAVRDLQRQAAELGYERSALDAELDEVSSPESLALSAAKLGMRPNPYPAFVDLSSGGIIGNPRTVKGNEVPGVVVRSGAEIRAEQIKQRKAEEERQRAAAAKKAAEQRKRDEAAKKKAAADAKKKADSETTTKPTTKTDGGN